MMTATAARETTTITTTNTNTAVKKLLKVSEKVSKYDLPEEDEVAEGGGSGSDLKFRRKSNFRNKMRILSGESKNLLLTGRVLDENEEIAG
jgi:hypothetical protein